MLLDNPFSSVAVGAFLADIIASLREPNQSDAIQAKLVAEMGPLSVYGYFPISGEIPAFVVGCNQTTGLVCVDGMSTLAQATGLAAGYAGGLLDSITDPVNQYIVDRANDLITAIGFAKFQKRANNIIAGWSLGGALAEQVSAVYRSQQDGTFTHYVTFGSPRIGGPSQNAAISRAAGMRWMNDQDPVPLIPPHLSESFLYTATLSARQALRISHIGQPAGGYQITAAGTGSAQEIPTGSTWGGTISIAAWALGQDSDGQNQHAIILYQRRLAAMAAADARDANRSIQTAPTESVSDLSRRAYSEANARVNRAYRSAGQQQTSVPQELPPSRSMRAYKIGSEWVVYFGDNLIAVGPEKKRARALARVGNDFLRRLQLQSLVEVDELESCLTAYLVDASIDGNGWTPPIATEIPFGG